MTQPKPTPTLEDVLLELVDPGFNFRFDLNLTPEFRECIRVEGVRVPISLTKLATGRYRTIAGHRRAQAAREAGHKTIPALIHGEMPEAEEKALGLLDNIAREDITPYDTFMGLKALRELGMKGKDIATKSGLSEAMVSQIGALDKLCPEAMEAFKAGKIGVTKAYKVAASPDQLATLSLFLGGETRDAVAQKTRAAKTSDSDTEKTEKLPVALSTGIVIIKAKKDKDGKETLNLAAARQLLVDAMAKVDNAIRLGYSAKTAAKAWDETKNVSAR